MARTLTPAAGLALAFVPGLAAPPAALGQAGACGALSVTPAPFPPNPGTGVNRLTAISARSAGEVYAAGLWRHTTVGMGPLVVRWDGGAWSTISMPSTAQVGTDPQTVGIAALSGGEVWVAGYVTTTYPTYNMPLLMRWREGQWDFVGTATLNSQNTYPYAARGGLLSAVGGVSGDDIWAVGLATGFGDGGATAVPLAVHWDGSAWTEAPVPRVANRHHDLVAVAAIAGDDVWAVGEYRNVAGAYRGVAYHWDGGAWSHVPSPIEDIAGSGLLDIAAGGPSDVWALGSGPGGVVLMHWDGAQWSTVPGPPDTGGSIAVPAPGEVVISGWEGYWRRTAAGGWMLIPASLPGPPAAAYTIRGGGLAVVPGGGCELWGAGFWTLPDGVTSFTLAERLSAAGAACYANCDGSTTAPVLNVADFTCFLQRFAAGESYANCDGSTAPPVLNVADFTCFLQRFAAGCP